uniref:uncharacterized protein LOC120341888 isoform X1 n=2 Tax=Styela clava TaxID=7725 RepID=UPI00193A4C08|nr:uncharacterized protein LOC120341888 isoform X1 [Styela clava]
MVLGNGSKQWIHPSESLINGRVTYTVKFMGKAEVPEPRGMPMVKAALKKLSFTRQIKRTEGTKPPKVELGININYVTISDIKSKDILHRINLQRVSFCADDKEDKRLFAFIAKLDDNKHYCYGLDSLHQANDITLTIGQAFELAYEKFVKDNPSTPGTKKITEMSKRIQDLESENDELRKRIAELEAVQRANANGNDPVLIETKPRSPPSIPQTTTNPVVPRRSHPVPTPITSPRQEAIHNIFQPETKTTSVSSLFSSLPKEQNHDILVDLTAHGNSSTAVSGTHHAETTYTSINRGARSTAKTSDTSNAQHRENTIDGTTPSSVSNSVRKFRNSLQRNMRKTKASEDRMKKTLSSLIPAKILSRKLKRTKALDGEMEAHRFFDESSTSSCSSPRSSTYANLDDVIATLQNMMTKTDGRTKSSSLLEQSIPGKTIGEKLATHHDPSQHNYNSILRHLPESVNNNKSELHHPKKMPTISVSTAIQNTTKPNRQSFSPSKNILKHSESVNSNDDVSSLSTTTTDSSSAEHVYILQPMSSTTSSFNVSNAISGSKTFHHRSEDHAQSRLNLQMGHVPTTSFQSPSIANTSIPKPAPKKIPWRNRLPGWSDNNLDDTLRQLGGEEGYMVLSGKDHVQNILNNTSLPTTGNAYQEMQVDSTYDNVNRLMEAVREAAAKDAAREGEDVKKILTTPGLVMPPAYKKSNQPNFNDFPPIMNPHSNQSRLVSHEPRARIPSTISSSTEFGDLDTISLDSFANPLLHIQRRDFSKINQDHHHYHGYNGGRPIAHANMQNSVHNPFGTTSFQTHAMHSGEVLPIGRRMRASQETDILHSHNQMSLPLDSRQRLTSEDIFNMQPFVPMTNTARLPQPPSRKPTRPQNANPWSNDMFDPLQVQPKINREVMDVQNMWGTSSPDSAQLYSKSKKSNYHIVSHPLIRKKTRKNQSPALKWSKKYFPSGKKKRYKTSSSANQLSGFDNQFSRGLMMSEEHVTLDSFDPLKH